MNSKQGLGLVFITALISGVSIFLNKFGVKGFDPSVFTFLKNLCVGILLIGTLLAIKDYKLIKKLTKQQWGKLALIGLVGGSIPFLLFFNGLKLTNAATGSFIHKTMFIWIALASVFFLREKLNRNVVIAAVLLLIGNAFLLKLTGFDLGLGALLIFIATLFWSTEILLSKSLLNVKNIPGRLVACGRMSFGALFLLLFVLFTGKATSIVTYSNSQWLWVLFTSILLYGYVFTFYSGLKLVNPVTAAMILLLGSPITTLLNVFFAGAAITPQQLFGILLVVVGVFAGLVGTGYFAWIAKRVPVRSRD